MIKNSRRKKIIVLVSGVFTLALLITIAQIVLMLTSNTVSGSPVVQNAPSIATETTPIPNTPSVQDLNGHWEADSGNGATMTAVVANQQITITLNNEGSKMLYWVGTFEPTAGNGNTVTSDKVKVRKAVLSRANSKEFVIGESIITFELSALGKTTTIHLHRV